jgi:hypothetical protein
LAREYGVKDIERLNDRSSTLPPADLQVDLFELDGDPMRKTPFGRDVNRWERALAGRTANADDLPTLEEPCRQLEALIPEIKDLYAQRDALKAELLAVQQKIRERIAEGQDLSSRIYFGVRSAYGPDSAKLYEFGMKPDRRFRKRPPAGADPAR